MKRNNQCAAAVLLWVALGAAAQVLARPAPADNPLQISIEHVSVSVADLHKEVEWYTRVLGFHATTHYQRAPDFELQAMHIPGFHIDLISQQGSSRPASSSRPYFTQGWGLIIFRTAGSIDSVYDQLKASGVEVTAFRDNKSKSISRVDLQDPEGNAIEIKAKDTP